MAVECVLILYTDPEPDHDEVRSLMDAMVRLERLDADDRDAPVRVIGDEGPIDHDVARCVAARLSEQGELSADVDVRAYSMAEQRTWFGRRRPSRIVAVVRRRRTVGEQSVIDDEVASLTRELVALCGQLTPPAFTGHPRVHQLGLSLNDVDGMSAMLRAAQPFHATSRRRYLRHLEHAWDGIGDWRA